MSIFLRQSRISDLADLYNLASQFTLLNLPANKTRLKKILQISEQSFKHKLSLNESEFLFVAEDGDIGKVIGASKIVSKHGTKDNPHIFYKIQEKEKFSQELGLRLTHETLNFKEDYDGPTELGGLIVDENYRKRPEKIGKIISLVRFMFIAAYEKMFQEELHCELAPPLTIHGKSEFWEALGKRFTNLPYEEANRLSHKNKEFIKNLFPENKIYITLLELKAKAVIGKVSEATKPAKALMEKLGFTYKNEIDPFDGGPHFGVKTKLAKPIQAFKKLKLKIKEKPLTPSKMYLLGGTSSKEFRAILCFLKVSGDQVFISKEQNKLLEFVSNQEVFILPVDY